MCGHCLSNGKKGSPLLGIFFLSFHFLIRFAVPEASVFRIEDISAELAKGKLKISCQMPVSIAYLAPDLSMTHLPTIAFSELSIESELGHGGTQQKKRKYCFSGRFFFSSQFYSFGTSIQGAVQGQSSGREKDTQTRRGGLRELLRVSAGAKIGGQYHGVRSALSSFYSAWAVYCDQIKRSQENESPQPGLPVRCVHAAGSQSCHGICGTW